MARKKNSHVSKQNRQMLDHDLEEAEEQYQQAMRAHLAAVDQLLDLQHARMAALDRQFTEGLRALQDEFERWAGCSAAPLALGWRQVMR